MHNEDEFAARPSKAQLKRDAEHAQVLGTALVELPDAQLKDLFNQLALPDKLREAILACRTIKVHGARRRQLQYIGKLMRGIDLAPVQAQLEQIRRRGQANAAQHHQIEHWRERLLQEGEAALTELLQTCPELDAGRVRQLMQRAQHETAHAQPPRAARELFRYLREQLSS